MDKVTVGGKSNQECGRVSKKEARKQEPIIDFHSLREQMHDALKQEMRDNPGSMRYDPDTLEWLVNVALKVLPESNINFEITIRDDMVVKVRPYQRVITLTVEV